MTALELTEDTYGHSLDAAWAPPEDFQAEVPGGSMSPYMIRSSWLFAPDDRGPDRGRLTLWARRSTLSPHTYWGYDGTTRDCPEWVQALSAIAYGEALGHEVPALPGFTRTESVRARWLERRFTVSGAPELPCTLGGKPFAAARGMIAWSIGSGKPDRSQVWLWGEGFSSAEYRNGAGMPSWLDGEYAAVFSDLEAAALPPGWETHAPMTRPERRRGA